MSDLNRQQVLGRLGADPETRTVGDTSVTSLSVATGEKWTSKATGQKEERTTWHRFELWGRMGEVAQQYLKKGDQIYLEGTTNTDKYQDKQTGQDRYSTKVRATEMQLIGGPRDGERHADSHAAKAGGAGTDFDDSIPFDRVRGVL